jgi:hypothetical protein
MPPVLLQKTSSRGINQNDVLPEPLIDWRLEREFWKIFDVDRPVSEPDDDSSLREAAGNLGAENTAKAKALAKQKRTAAIILAIGIAVILASLVVRLVRE